MERAIFNCVCHSVARQASLRRPQLSHPSCQKQRTPDRSSASLPPSFPPSSVTLACTERNASTLQRQKKKEASLSGTAKIVQIQRSAKVCVPGLINSITAVAYHFCLNLTAAFTKAGASTRGWTFKRTKSIFLCNLWIETKLPYLK